MLKQLLERRSLKLAGMVLGLMGVMVLLSIPQVMGNSGPVLRVRAYSDIQILDPANPLSSCEMDIFRGIYSKLVRFKPGSYELENDAAEWIKVSEDSKVIEFKLKEGIQFHKGYGEMTAEDVKFSYERVVDPEVHSAYAADWSALDHVEVTGRYSGKIILKNPFAPLFKTTLPWTVGNIISKKAYEEKGEKFATDPIGSGPYYFDEWTPKQKLVLTTFDDYFGEKPYFERIEIYPIEDEKSAEIAFDTGEVDFTEVSMEGVLRYKTDPKVNYRQLSGLAWYWIGMNVEKEPFTDVLVRKAIRYAIDVDQVIEGAYLDVPERSNAILARGLLGYWADAPVYKRDVEKAKLLLKAAGYPNGFETKMDILNKTEYKAVAEIIQSNLADIGVDMQINVHDSGTFWTLTFGETGKDIELIHDRYSGAPDPSWIVCWYLCEQVGQWNAMQWCNESFDELHYAALATMDDKEREQFYIEMQKLMDEEAVGIWYMHDVRAFVARKDIEMGLLPNGDLLYYAFKIKE